jgi:hypothetical protein
MKSDNLGDWRIDTVGQTAQPYGDVPAGSPIWLMSLAKHKKLKYLSFPTPSPAALCLSIGIEAAARGEVIRPRLSLTPSLTHENKRGFQINQESIHDLYYFFEQSIISVTMSFQAIEVFANAIIGRRASGTILVRRRAGDKNLSAIDAERELSTEEKLGQVLPGLMGVPCPRDKRAWQSFKILKRGRDATVHLKSQDIYTRNNVDRESLFFYFLNHDLRTFPSAAINTMSYFFPQQLPRWLQHAKGLAERDSHFGAAGA